jgi:hypothetical protein
VLYSYVVEMAEPVEMDKSTLTPEESITIISKAIANYKMNYKENAKK